MYYCKFNVYELGGEVLFTIQFGIAVKKKYASGYSIRTGLTQQEALSYTAFGDVDIIPVLPLPGECYCVLIVS